MTHIIPSYIVVLVEPTVKINSYNGLNMIKHLIFIDIHIPY